MNGILAIICIVFFTLTTPILAQDSNTPPDGSSTDKAGGVKSLEKRIKQLEDAVTREVEGEKWYDRIQVSGLIEVEAGYQSVKFDDPQTADENNSDVDLATVELVVDARIVNHVDGHVMFKYEDDELFVDEGFITLIGTKEFPAYLIAGLQYVPFGYYDSFFVTDPNTLVLGETNAGAAVAGYRFGGGMVDISFGAFNGRVDKIDKDDHIDSFVAGLAAQPIEPLMFGLSYTSNLAASDTFSEFIVDEVDSLVGGWSAFATFEFLDRFKIIGEYVGALGDFEIGEVYDAEDPLERQPTAWNIELGATIIDNVELALRYGGADDGGAEFLPETQYGAVVNWGFFKSINLALEYIHDEFEDDIQEVDTFTAQLAVEF